MKKLRQKQLRRQPSSGATRRYAAPVIKKKQSFAWLNRVLVFVAVLAVTALAAKGYIALNAMPVEHIIVSGKLQHTKRDVLEEMVRPALIGGFLNADLQRVRTQLQSLPWVYEATVRRRWPNALELHVVEQLPIARWGDSGFLNHQGSVFKSVEGGEDWRSLPLLQGPEGTAGRLMSIYQQVVEIIGPNKLIVEELSIDDRGQVEARLQGGIILVMGAEDLVEQRLRRFVALYRADLIFHKDTIASVDLRYPNGLAVGYRETPQVAGI